MRTALLLSSFIFVAANATEVSDTDYRYWQELGLANADLTRFKQLTHFPGLISATIKSDPLLVLGIYAKDKAEQERFAQLYLRRELDRAEREIAFFRIYADLFDDQIGGRPLVNLAALGIKPPRESAPNAERLTVLVNQNCTTCDALANVVTQRVKQGDFLGVDLYVSDAGNDQALQAWAKRVSLDSTLVQSGQITLNLGGPLSEQLQTSAYPAVYKRSGDRLQQLSVTEHISLLGPKP